MKSDDISEPLSFMNSNTKNSFWSFIVWKERALYLIIALLILLTFFLASQVFSDQEEESVFRSQSDIELAAKKFVSCLYSLDAATVREDQFCAIQFMLNEKDKETHTDYLKNTQLITTAEKKGIKSFFLWNNSKIEFENNGDGTFDIYIRVPYRVIGVSTQTLEIIVTLQVVDISDQFIYGVGVKSWRDLAIDPIITE